MQTQEGADKVITLNTVAQMTQSLPVFSIVSTDRNRLFTQHQVESQRPRKPGILVKIDCFFEFFTDIQLASEEFYISDTVVVPC